MGIAPPYTRLSTFSLSSAPRSRRTLASETLSSRQSVSTSTKSRFSNIRRILSWRSAALIVCMHGIRTASVFAPTNKPSAPLSTRDLLHPRIGDRLHEPFYILVGRKDPASVAGQGIESSGTRHLEFGQLTFFQVGRVEPGVR